MKETDEPILKYEIGYRLALYSLFSLPVLLAVVTYIAGGK